MPETAPHDAVAASRDALLAAACLAVDPVALGGITVRTDRGAACERWLECFKSLLEETVPLRRLPPHIDDERLLGGLDLASTLGGGRASYSRGLLAETDGGVLILSMAECTPRRLSAVVAAALDTHGVDCADGARQCARFGLIALDSGQREDEACPALLTERLALQIDLRAIDALALSAALNRADVARARAQLASVVVEAEALRALCATASACGIDSLRAPLLALRVARISAALHARTKAVAEDLELAARLVLGPRARIAPESSTEEAPPPPPQSEAPSDAPQPDSRAADQEMDQQVLAAARATLPAGLLTGMLAGNAPLGPKGEAGRAGAAIVKGRLGRPAGVRNGRPRQDSRLNIVATLRAAAPWQRLRRAQANVPATRVLVRTEDFRVTWFRQRSQTATLFVIDASGSSAMHRLAEVKGAVELLLAECYVRRDQVAVVAFRGRGAELVLPPTRSLVRAKRCLAGMPGGGATPIASGLTLARQLAEQLRRRGLAPVLVVLTDGQANVARDGIGGRARAQEDALLAARQLRAGAFKTLLIDTAPRAQPLARALAQSMQGRYLPLPYADARALLDAVQSAA